MGAQAVRRLGVVQGWGNGRRRGLQLGSGGDGRRETGTTGQARRRTSPSFYGSRPLLSVMLMLQVEGLRRAHLFHAPCNPGDGARRLMSLDEAQLRGRDTKEVASSLVGLFDHHGGSSPAHDDGDTERRRREPNGRELETVCDLSGST